MILAHSTSASGWTLRTAPWADHPGIPANYLYEVHERRVVTHMLPNLGECLPGDLLPAHEFHEHNRGRHHFVVGGVVLVAWRLVVDHRPLDLPTC